MNILVTGANGQLGHEMQRVALGSKHHYIFTDVAEGYDQLDITNIDAVRAMVKERNVNVIVNCAAYTNVDKAETDYDFANLLNNTSCYSHEGSRRHAYTREHRLCVPRRP